MIRITNTQPYNEFLTFTDFTNLQHPSCRHFYLIKQYSDQLSVED